jgi:alpha-tubulin suppressor-like RCC1 family protein
MTRFWSAILLAVLVALTGCGSSKTSAPETSTGNKGQFGVFYLVSLPRPVGGTIHSADGKVNCGTAAGANNCGPVSYLWEEKVTLEATADAGYTFYSWAGDCFGSGPCVLDNTFYGADKTVAAVFTNGTSWTLSVAKVGAGLGTITAAIPGQSAATCAADVRNCTFAVPITNPATTVVLTASADPSSHFSGWSGPCTGLGTCSVDVGKALVAVASFDPGPTDQPFNCGDLVETDILQRWSFTDSMNAPTTLSVLDAPNVHRGQHALRAVTASGYDFALNYTTPAGSFLDVSEYQYLRFAIRALNTNFAWQGSFPVVVLQDTVGIRRQYTPNVNFLLRDGVTWVQVAVPLAGSSVWATSGGSVDMTRIARLEVHTDTWDNSYTLDLDGMSFDNSPTCLPSATAIISSFSATPASISAGQTVSLSWIVTGATSLSIDQGVGAVMGTSVAVSPAVTTTYTLTATNPGGSVSATAIVTVAAQATYSVGGIVSGLVGSGLVLQDNGGDDVAVSASGAFLFPARLAPGSPYSVTIAQQPSNPSQVCTATGGAGTIGSSDVTSIAINCTPTWLRISAGERHSMGLRSDGTLWAWGSNAYGQLGDGTNTNQLVPKQIGTGFISVAAGTTHTAAVKTDGTLWAWGNNVYGQIGDGTTTQRNVPTQVGTGFASVASGYDHTVALTNDGALWAWGNNVYGQIGDGTTTQQNVPKPIGTGFVYATTGLRHTVAVKSDATQWAWGSNAQGQLGDGTVTQQLSPKLVASGIASVAAGSLHTLAVKIDGTLWVSGWNGQGQLGDGTYTQRSSAIPIMTGVGSVAAGDMHSLVVKVDGALWTWGLNSGGMLGDGTTTLRNVPGQVGSAFASVDGGLAFSLGLKRDGTLWAWGSNSEGAIGDGSVFVNRLLPVQIP